MPKRSADDSVDQYITSLPPATRKVFQRVRTIIRRATPGATERISYQILRFDWQGKLLIYVAGWREHIGLYPITAGLARSLGKELKPYRHGKATLRFPLGEPLPTDLIRRIVKSRADEIRGVAGPRRRRSANTVTRDEKRRRAIQS